jgi:hypothetical protein
MSEGAEEGRQGWIAEATCVLLYSMLIFLLMLVWVRARRETHGSPGRWDDDFTGARGRTAVPVRLRPIGRDPHRRTTTNSNECVELAHYPQVGQLPGDPARTLRYCLHRPMISAMSPRSRRGACVSVGLRADFSALSSGP